jgi:transcriptional regulator with GAF, ATPase, and Fis domain
VLLLGETGTGKELIARAIHNTSSRKDKLMIKVNCATLPTNLIESELFGHEKGSFTGAIERKIGKFEMANNGTLFLDEIGEMPLDLQVKLLRALQEKEIERLGGKSTIKTDVRIIAATNRDLQKEVAEGRFRMDLFYRLNVFPIVLPPLRERKEDIPILALHFLDKYTKNTRQKNFDISGRVMKELINYHWPGNIRELEHLMERSILMTQGNIIKEIHLYNAKEKMINSTKSIQTKTLEEIERDYIISVLNQCNGKVSGHDGAAELLGLNPSTLSSKMRKLKITKEVLYGNK